jgi:hypothetical protein
MSDSTAGAMVFRNTRNQNGLGLNHTTGDHSGITNKFYHWLMSAALMAETTANFHFAK